MGRISRIYIAAVFVMLLTTVCLSADSVHVLSRGETLYSLARTYGVSLDDLLKKNSIQDPSGLSVGTRLIIPGNEETVSMTNAGSASTFYTVQKGDTYYGIARKNNLEVDTLLSMNDRDESRVLRVGETLLIRDSGNHSSVAVSVPAPVKHRAAVMVRNVPWWPVAGYMQPLDGKLEGVAIEADPLSYVHAVAGGSVVWTGPYRGFGHVVLVDSNGYIYLYGGNEDLFVNVGQNVSAGSRIGRLGSAGPDGGKQDMIFSVFREGVPVSPEDAPRG